MLFALTLCIIQFTHLKAVTASLKSKELLMCIQQEESR